MTIAFRPALPDDRRFIVATWSSSYKASQYAGFIWHEDWAAIMRPQIAAALDRPDVRSVVAFEETDRTFLYGFIAGDTSDSIPIVLYTYVKEPYRRTGVARSLFEAFGVDPVRPFVYACKTAVVSELSGKIPAARFDVTVARYPKEERRRSLWQKT